MVKVRWIVVQRLVFDEGVDVEVLAGDEGDR